MFVLDLHEFEYKDFLKNKVILCPNILWKKTYKNRRWICDMKNPKDKHITIIDPITPDGKEMLQELLRMFFDKYQVSQPYT